MNLQNAVIETSQTYPILAAVVDAARARLFWLEKPDPNGAAEFREGQALVHPNARVKEGNRYTDSFPKGSMTPNSSRSNTYDDHREANELEERYRFAREIADTLAQLVRERRVKKLALVVSHAEYAPLLEEIEQRTLGIDVRHCIAGLAKLTPPQIHEELRARELIP